MQKFFNTLDRIRPVYDWVYRITLVICKLLLVIDICITSYAVAGRMFNRFIPFLKDPAWSEEVVLTCMAYMAVLSAALAIRRGAHIRMTAFDKYIPQTILTFLDLLADFFVLILGFIMLSIGWRYATTLGGRGYYISITWLSKFWMYFPVPLAGLAMIMFELEALYNDARKFFIKEEK
ncbi:MAG: TRAP transporter small permease [Spirochaetales bacterium]|nr:TRAP transporter small permease [Spirochaetales bacterium]